MKKQIIFTLIICVIAGFSCKRGKSLSEKRAEERAAIALLIADRGYQILTTMPVDTVFAENELYRSSSGLYVRIINTGEGRKPRVGDRVIYRFYTFNLNGDTIARAMYPEELIEAPSFKFGYNEAPSKGVEEVISFLGRDGAAYAIIPSAIGDVEAQANITPYIYEIRHVKIE